MKNAITTFFLLHCILFSFAQDKEIQLGYDIKGAYRYPVIKEDLYEAKTLSDINPGYPSSWVSGYISVEITTTDNSETQKAVGTTYELNNDQINLLKKADIGSNITVDVIYNPKHSGNTADVKEVHFTYAVIPHTEASYPDGERLLRQYLRENTVDKIPKSLYPELGIATVIFNINEVGNITDIQMIESSGDEKTDKLLLQAVHKMPQWNPAKNLNGEKVKQAFEFSVGYMIGC